MPLPLHGVNTIQAGDLTFLLTVTSGGTAVHLTSEKSESGREAVEEYWLDKTQDLPSVRNYDRAALLEPRWSATTLCGREWAIMAAHDGGPLTRYSEAAYAPTCGRCLSLMDKHFPKPPADNRLELVAQVTADLVCEHGYAEVHHVPGDQQAALRSTVRKIVRTRTRHGSKTLVHEAMVVFTCEAIYDLRRDEHSRAAAEAVSRALRGEPLPAAKPAWRISWDTWATGD